MNTMSNNYFYRGLIASAHECPEQIALEELASGKTVTYGGLLQLVDAGVTFLDSHHYPDTVVVLANMGIETAVTYYAVTSSGRTAAMIDDDGETPYGLLLKTKHPELCIKPSDFVAYLTAFEQRGNDAREIPNANEVESVLFTSGSTGEPKIFGIPSGRNRLKKRLLPREGDEEYAVLNVRRPSSTPYRNNLKRALENRGRFVSVDASAMSSSTMDRLLTGRVIHEWSVTPTMVRQIFPHIQGDWIKSVHRLNLNGERVYRDDLELIFHTSSQVTVQVAYGLTEFGTISESSISVEDLVEITDPVPVGMPTKDVEIRTVDTSDKAQTGESGRVFVREAEGFSGTLSDAGEFTFEHFQLDGWQETGDYGFINDREELVILGRTQETVKIRGSRVSVLEVEDIIRDTGMVTAVLVAVYQDARGNDSLGALVVPIEGKEFTLAELRRRITEHYSLVMCPTRSIIVHEVPVLAAGKVDRVTATQMLNESHSEITSKESDLTLNVVRDIILKILPVQSLGLDEDIFEAGMDSLASLELLDQLSDAFGMILDVRVLLENPSVASLAGALQNYVQPKNQLSRLSSARTHEKASIYWILPGANPFMAQKLAVSIDGVRHIAVLNLGAMNGDVVLPDAESMISYLVNAIVADGHSTDDIFVAGFSSAGLIASEVARVLFDTHGIGRGAILIDPVDSQVLVPQTPYRGVVNPLHVMLGREGRLSTLDPVQMDHALLAVQLFALSRLHLKPIFVPTLHIARNQTKEQKSLWGNHSLSQYFMCDIPHLDFVRRPQHCAPFITEFVDKILAQS